MRTSRKTNKVYEETQLAEEIIIKINQDFIQNIYVFYQELIQSLSKTNQNRKENLSNTLFSRLQNLNVNLHQ